MLVLILFLQIFVSGSLSIDPRDVQVNLETSFVFTQKDLNKQNTVINGLKTLLAGLENHFRSRKSDTPIFRAQNLDGELTTFFKNVGRKLLKQNDDYLKNITKVFIKVIEDYHNRSKFNVMFDDEGVKNYVLDNNLNRWIFFPPDVIRANIQYALDNDDTIFHKVVQFADRVFNETDRAPLEEIAIDLTGGNKKRNNIAKIIKGAFNFIVFKKLDSLSDEKKDVLRKALRKMVYGYNKLDEDFEDRHIDTNIKIKVDGKGIAAELTKPSLAKTKTKEHAEGEKEKLSEDDEKVHEGKEKMLEINETAKDVKKGHSEGLTIEDKASHSELNEQVEDKNEKHSERNKQADAVEHKSSVINLRAKDETGSSSEAKEHKKVEKDKPPKKYEQKKDKKDKSSEIDEKEKSEPSREKPETYQQKSERYKEKSEIKSAEKIRRDGEELLSQLQKEVRRMNIMNY